MSLRSRFRDMPIRNKLMWIGLLTSGFALLALSLILTIKDTVEWRNRTESDLKTDAAVIGMNAAPAMFFDDHKSAAETLAALSNKPEIDHAILYDRNGKVFASYLSPSTTNNANNHPPTHPVLLGGHYYVKNHMVVSESVRYKSDILGSISLESDMEGLYTGLIYDILSIFVAAFIAFVIAVLFFVRLQRAIVVPIVNLAEVMRGISKEQNYAARAEVSGRDEVGMLAQTFNGMLDRIQERDSELALHRAHLEEKVAERTATLSQAQRIAHLGSWEWDIVNNRVVWSDEMYRIFGLDPTQFEATYEAFLNNVHPEDQQSVDESVHGALEKQLPYNIEYRILLPDGKVKHVHAQGEATFAEDGTPLKMQGTLLDITDSKLINEELVRGRLLLQNVLESVPIRVFWKDRDLRYLGCNTLFAKDAGLKSPDVLTGKTDFDVSWRDQAELYRADDRKVMDSGIPKVGYEEPQTTPEGKTIWLRTSKVPLRNADQEVIGILGVYDDITEWRQAEQSLKLFRQLIEQSKDAIEVIDQKTMQFLDVNEAACLDLGYSREELLSLRVFDIDSVLDQSMNDSIQKQVQESGSAIFETRHKRKDGSVFPVEINLKQVTFGNQVYLVAIVRDITERKRAEEEIRQLNEQLEQKVEERTKQLLEAQDELVRKEKLSVLGQVAGSVGHELRNPLGVMNNAVYFLQTVLTDADETTKEYLGIIKDEISNADRIVGDLLDSVRTKPPQLKTIILEDLIEQTLTKCSIPKTVSVVKNIPADLASVKADPLQMQQVFRNLITNGIEAMTEGGKLEIAASSDSAAKTVVISVKDSGTGISLENMAKLFRPLYTTKPRGIGLGLMVVKNLTEANGGKVGVTSEVGKGTTFTVTLQASV